MTRLIVVLLFSALSLLAGCDTHKAHESDDRLKAAIASGAFGPGLAGAGAVSDPLETDPLRTIELLGAHEYRASVTYRYSGEDGVESELEESTNLVCDASGRFRLNVQRQFRRVDDPPGKSSREAVWDGRTFYTRTGSAHFLAWDPLRRPQEGWLREATRHLPTVLRMLAPGVVLERQGRRLVPALRAWSPPALPQGVSLREARHSEGDDWYVWWQRTHRPTQITGEVRLHDAADVVAQAEIRLEAATTGTKRPREVLSEPEITEGPSPFGWGASEKEPEKAAAPLPKKEEPRSAPATFHATTRVTIRALPEAPVIQAPDEGDVREPRRPRVQHMIDTLIGPGHVP